MEFDFTCMSMYIKIEKKEPEEHRFLQCSWASPAIHLITYLPLFDRASAIRFRFLTADAPLFVAELRRVVAA